MFYKNKKSMMAILLLAILALLYFTYQFKGIEYRVFGTIGVIWASIIYVCTLFEYYKIDDTKIIHVYRLGLKKEEICWEDINKVFIISNGYFKAVRINSRISGKCMIINSGIKGYNRLLKAVIDRTEENFNIAIDKRLHDFLK